MHWRSSTRPHNAPNLTIIDLRTDEPTVPVWVEPVDRDGQGHRIARLRCTDLDALHDFVDRAGLGDAGCVIGSVATLTHYVLTVSQRRQAIRAGATAVDWGDAYERIATLTVIGTRPPERPTPVRLGMRRDVAWTQPAPGLLVDRSEVNKRAFRRTTFGAREAVR